MNTQLRNLVLVLMALCSLTACKIDLSVVGLGKVDTVSGSFHCDASSSSTGEGCTHYYLSNVQCPIDFTDPESTEYTQCMTENTCDAEDTNCTQVTGDVHESFIATNSDGSLFEGWIGGVVCSFGASVCKVDVSSYNAINGGTTSIAAQFSDPQPAVAETTYTYNALGQRDSKSVSTTIIVDEEPVTTTVTTYFDYDLAGMLLGEYDVAGTPVQEYVYANGERIAVIDSSAQVHYYINDHHGQPQNTFTLDAYSNLNGGTTELNSDAFGGTYGNYSTGLVQPHREMGQYADKETGYYYNMNRTYDPTTGYTDTDPIGLNGGINTYGYAYQNPVMNTDKSGLVPNPLELTCIDPLQPVCAVGVAADVATDLLVAGEVAEGVTAVSEAGEVAEVCLSQGQKRALTKIKNVLNNFKDSDIEGLLKDMSGNPVFKNGKYYNHLQEVSDYLRSLRNSVEILEGVGGEAVQSARQGAMVAIDRIMVAIQGYGI